MRPAQGGEEASSSALKDALAWRRARNAFEAADYDAAFVAVEELLERNPSSSRALRFKRDVHVRRGDLTDAVRTLRRLRVTEDDPSWEAPQRMLLGRLIETDPRWAPRIPTSIARGKRDSSGRASLLMPASSSPNHLRPTGSAQNGAKITRSSGFTSAFTASRAASQSVSGTT